jgi:putative GTP pyrophosphokinase
MAKKKKQEIGVPEVQITWYEKHQYLYESLGRTVEGLLREFLISKRIDFLAVTSRPKTVESFRSKIERKQYKDPRTEVTDLCGVRVITYLESDVQRVAEAVREAFTVDDTRSLDKSGELSVDRVGYRSVHFICSLGSRRTGLPEYLPFADLVFEIQVRTVLQHAWAQIEHDRNYKFGGVLPPLLQRRLFLAAGLLEVADREFDARTKEIENYSTVVAQRTSRGDLDLEITSQSLLAYLDQRRGDFGTSIRPVMESTDIQQVIIQELREFGITTIRALDELLSSGTYLSAMKRHHAKEITDLGLIREAMMYMDLHRYFDSAWGGHWNAIVGETFDLLKEKYSEDELRKTLAKRVTAVAREGWIEEL